MTLSMAVIASKSKLIGSMLARRPLSVEGSQRLTVPLLIDSFLSFEAILATNMTKEIKAKRTELTEVIVFEIESRLLQFRSGKGLNNGVVCRK